MLFFHFGSAVKTFGEHREPFAKLLDDVLIGDSLVARPILYNSTQSYRYVDRVFAEVPETITNQYILPVDIMLHSALVMMNVPALLPLCGLHVAKVRRPPNGFGANPESCVIT